MAEKFRIDSITLGEMLDMEMASGLDFLAVSKSRTGMMLIAKFLLALRKPDNEQSPQELWDDLTSERLLDGSTSKGSQSGSAATTSEG